MKRTLAMLVPAAAISIALAGAAIAVAASSPTVTTGTHSRVTDTSAVLHGSVNPNGSATTYYFQWGLTPAYGLQSVAHSTGHGTKAVSVTTTATGLIPGTAYHYRLVATNAAGTAVGADRTFTSAGNPPPNVATGPASPVGKNDATVTGVVSPNKQDTTYYFQYGTSTSYGSQTIAATIPAGTVPVTVSAALQGLEARTIFHYRLVALHANTVAQAGADGTFMTLPRHRPVPSIRATVKPGHDAHKPFVFATSGSIKGPNWIPAAYDCRGNVNVKFLLGGRRIGSTLLPVQPDCKFSGQTVFNHLPHNGHLPRPVSLTVIVRYAGNGYLTPRKASPMTVNEG
jgi:phosphodiesterase/alkaline phosphatase D-like protein